MSQRRFSRGVNDNDLTLEQRLVMQLSAAMRHDEQTSEEPVVSAPNRPELARIPSTEQLGHQNEPTDWSNLIGSLSTALGNPPPTNTDAQPMLNKTPTLVNAPAHNAGTIPPSSQPSQLGNPPIQQPAIDFSTLDLSALGNLRLSDLGILSNLGNLWDPNGDGSGQGNHMVDANNLLQTLGTLSHIGNLANQASHGNLESLGSLNNLANFGSLGSLNRLNHQSYDYNHPASPHMPINPPHSGSPAERSLPAEHHPMALGNAQVPPRLDFHKSIASGTGAGPTNRAFSPQSHPKPTELPNSMESPRYSAETGPTYPSLAGNNGTGLPAPAMGRTANYPSVPQPTAVNNISPDSPRLDFNHPKSFPATATPPVPDGSALSRASPLPSAVTNARTTGERVGPSPSFTNTQPNHTQPNHTQSNHSQSNLTGRSTTPSLRFDSELPTNSSRSRESLLSLHEHIPTAIDPEVSSIQSVLQSLLTGGTVPGLDDNENTTTPTGTERPQSPLPPPTTTKNATTEPVNPSMVFGNLSELGLGAEDQALIESLRSAISFPATNTTTVPETVTTLKTARTDYSPSLQSARLPRASADFSERPIRPRNTGGITKYRRTKLPSRAEFEPRPIESSSSEFNASDTDTLRAIQQALLSAMGPLASSTSLAESLTSTAAAHNAAAAAAAAAAATAASASTAAVTDPATTTATATTTHTPTTTENDGGNKSIPDTTLTTESFAASSPASPALSLTPISSKSGGDPPSTKASTLKKPVTKVVKTSETDKQKLRDENAARKRKWREVHLMQNKDNDLRLRIMKRANEIHGSEESLKKTEWINEEFERRRQRRIFRAGINSIVDAARARAAKAVENGEPARTPLEYARMHISDHARTLTQQSKQAAKSHLSQLFRNSNAALGPQLHKDKVPLPMAAYMLVSSPRRPPYKISKTPTSLTEDKASASPSSSNTKDAEKTTESEPSSESNHDLASASGPASDSPAHSELLDGDQPGNQETGVSKKTGANASEEHPQASSNSPASPHDKSLKSPDLRPKHRYGLIGQLKLGVPPNLSAIYHKIRGTNPFDYQTRLSAQDS